ncbi:MAG: RnfH family protein [Zoogloeaceae bacterium]|jgi:putative ubiquitin-RnfH superfamily antitoxin RatB of RatAB toxin-antitoxin module|nr:RnfH family protein [Zoogloeaceae bacterium]
MSEAIHVEVVYALPDKQEIVPLDLPAGSTLGDAVEASGLAGKYPRIDLASGKFGIFSKLAKTDTPLRDRDRVEIYRPLIADPKTARAARAGKASEKAGE